MEINYGLLTQHFRAPYCTMPHILGDAAVKISLLSLCLCEGPFKCYITQMGGGLIFWKEVLRRCNVQCY